MGGGGVYMCLAHCGWKYGMDFVCVCVRVHE